MTARELIATLTSLPVECHDWQVGIYDSAVIEVCQAFPDTENACDIQGVFLNAKAGRVVVSPYPFGQIAKVSEPDALF